MLIRPCAPGDEGEVCSIYNHYIEHTTVTFEEQPVAGAAMQERIAAHSAHYPWLVAQQADGPLLGYAYASRWHARAAYRHTVELTVYLHPAHTGRGLGRALYAELIAQLSAPERGPDAVHVLLGCIALPNAASVGLHEALGFQKIGHFSEVGRKFGRWIDVGFWQKTLG